MHHTIEIHTEPSAGKKPAIQTGFAWHVGLARESNEDSFLALPKKSLWAVVDGMGGHECGEVASAVAVAAMKSAICNGLSLEQAMQHAHRTIRKIADEGFAKSDMGATAVALSVESTDRYKIAWIGDSRAYLWRSGSLTQLTRDHSYVQLMIDRGLISREAAAGHPYKNVVTRALGSRESEEIRPETAAGEILQNDIFLLCSDGLSGEVSDETLAKIMSQNCDVQEKVRHLVSAALESGGNDNITIVLLAFGDQTDMGDGLP
ncbi:MAG: PP2C family protein-serine/threonine phosphatase [Gammaproteobacteria bacterium]